MVQKGVLSDFIDLFFENCGRPRETIDNLWFKPFEHHLLALLVHLSHRVDVLQQVVDGVTLEILDLIFQLLDLQQNLFVLFLFYDLPIKLIGNFIFAELRI